jgi:hypothetical protein
MVGTGEAGRIMPSLVLETKFGTSKVGSLALFSCFSALGLIRE